MSRPSSSSRRGGFASRSRRATRPTPCGPCNPDEQGYLGTANTTLRVLLTSANRFVWGLDNAAPLFRVRITGLDATPLTKVEVEMFTPPTGEAELPVRSRVVEILPFGALLEGGDLPSGSDSPHSRKVATEIGLFARVRGDDTNYDQHPEVRARDRHAGRSGACRGASRPRAHLVVVAPGRGHAQWFADRHGALLLHAPLAPGAQQADIELIAPVDDTGAALGDTGIVPVLEENGRRGDYWAGHAAPGYAAARDPRSTSWVKTGCLRTALATSTRRSRWFTAGPTTSWRATPTAVRACVASTIAIASPAPWVTASTARASSARSRPPSTPCRAPAEK